MPDVIQGRVSFIMDQRTFSIEISHVGAKNSDKYLTTETVRILHLKTSMLDKVTTSHSKIELEKLLKDQQVKCWVHHRDSYHRIVADIAILN